MIKATELRIGNKIKFMGSTLTVSPKTISNICYTLGEPSQLYEPIPITKDWLLKFGLVTQNRFFGVGYKITMEIEPSYILGESSRELTVSPDGEKYFLDGNYLMRLKYIHQLQNLYFALTGEELKLIK